LQTRLQKIQRSANENGITHLTMVGAVVVTNARLTQIDWLINSAPVFSFAPAPGTSPANDIETAV
jgi:hypothetical protein